MTPCIVRLAPDNITPPTRTPWGGRRIIDHYKAGLLAVDRGTVVGESWEMSVEPSFPSRCDDNGQRLSDRIAQDPIAWLGAEEAQRLGQTPLLVKLLDAAEPLSVQVHPSDDDPALTANESGKPEAWVILDAEPGARLYLGFRKGVNREHVAALLRSGSSLVDAMNIVPVQTGDAFLLQPGMPHAIGAGITLLEPQLVRPGRVGVTYRFWDWNRRYTADGRPDAGGTPRTLHVERSLAVTNWDAPRGVACVDACRANPRPTGDHVRYIDGPWCRLVRWVGDGERRTHTDGRLLCLVCSAGEATVVTDSTTLTLRRGQTAVVPACTGALEMDLRGGSLFGIQTV